MMNHGSGEPSTSLSWLLDIDDQLMDKISNGILCWVLKTLVLLNERTIMVNVN